MTTSPADHQQTNNKEDDDEDDDGSVHVWFFKELVNSIGTVV